MKANYNRETSYIGLTSAMESPGNPPGDAQTDAVDYRLDEPGKRLLSRNCILITVLFLATSGIMFAAGLLAGRQVSDPQSSDNGNEVMLSAEDVKTDILQSIDRNNIKNLLR